MSLPPVRSKRLVFCKYCGDPVLKSKMREHAETHVYVNEKAKLPPDDWAKLNDKRK